MVQEKKYVTALVCFSFVLFATACFETKQMTQVTNMPEIVWADEFDYSGLPDSTKWSYDAGDGCPDLCGWGNQELQYYTAFDSKNARVEDGKLIIEVHKAKTGARDYSSARLVTKQKGDWTYGRIEVRAKMPKGRGTWPAIWMLSTDWNYGGWPESGEIDIMEHVGFWPDSILGTVHTKNYNHLLGTQKTAGIHSKTLSSDFHIYAIEWDAQKIDFFFDGVLYNSFVNDGRGFKSWPFDQDFHLILNMAVGGTWGGEKGIDDSIWPQRMEIDWVRVFQEKTKHIPKDTRAK